MSPANSWLTWSSGNCVQPLLCDSAAEERGSAEVAPVSNSRTPASAAGAFSCAKASPGAPTSTTKAAMTSRAGHLFRAIASLLIYAV